MPTAPTQQAEVEVKSMIDAEKKRMPPIPPDFIPVMPIESVFEMLEAMMIMAWVRGYNAKTETLN